MTSRRLRDSALGLLAATSLLGVLTFQPREAHGATIGAVHQQSGLVLGGLGLGALALQRRGDQRAVGLAGVALVSGLACAGCEPTSSAAGRRLERSDNTHATDHPLDATPGRVTLPESALHYIRVETAAHEPEDMSIRAPARVAFRDNAVSKVDAPAAGRITRLLVEVGADVKAGDPLVEMASSQASALHMQRQQARLERERAERALVRQDALMRSGIGRELDRHTARLELEGARIAEQHAQRAVAMLGRSRGGKVTVVAPIDGTVLRRYATVGTQVEPGGAPLLEIGDKGALWVVAEVFEDDLPRIRPDAPVALRFASVPEPVPGRVVGVGALVDVGLRRAPVYVAIDDARAGAVQAALTPGMFARADIDDPTTQGVTLPKAAVLIQDGETSTAFVEVGPGVFEAREVVVGHTSNDRAQVVSGISPGERVAVAGALLIDQQTRL